MKTPKFITDFMYAVYPDYGSLALASFNEEKTLIDATETILELREENAALVKALDRATSNKYAVQNDDMKTYTVHEERDYSRLTPDDIALCERLEREVWSKKS